MATKTIYIPDNIYFRLGAVGNEMMAEDSKLKNREIISNVIRVCIDNHLPVLEEKYGLK